jgi:FMN phosphatase YigB (HAD superfamily)
MSDGSGKLAAMNPGYQICLFDYGNTLVEFDRPQIESIVRRFREELVKICGPVGEAELEAAMDRLYQLPRLGDAPTLRELPPVDQMEILIKDLYRDLPAPCPREDLICADDALQAIFVDTVAIRPRERRLLDQLSRKMPLGLVSNYPCGRAIRASLRRLEIDGFFRSIVISGEVGFVKPHPAIFREAIDGLRADPALTLFVGDRWEADVCGARDVGLRSCHMLGFTSETGFEERYAIYRPDHIARSLEEVAEILGAG